jgi:hypothetical protein
MLRCAVPFCVLVSRSSFAGGAPACALRPLGACVSPPAIGTRGCTPPWMLVGRCAFRLLARPLLAHTACRAAPCRAFWRPAPSALQLTLGARVAMADQRAAAGKQPSIAAFFGGGGQPKRTAASATPPGGSAAAKRGADEAETLAGARAAP